MSNSWQKMVSRRIPNKADLPCNEEHANIQPETMNTRKLKYIVLTLSLIELAIGLSNARQNVFFYLGLPVGAILFGLFLITQVLEKESALYDEQNRAAELRRNPGEIRRGPSPIPQEVAHYPVLTLANPS